MNIAIIGYGKMGRMIEEIAKQRGHNIVCIIDQDNQADFDSPNFASADVAIEFTSPQAAFQNYRGLLDGSNNTAKRLNTCAKKRVKRCSGPATSRWEWPSLEHLTADWPN